MYICIYGHSNTLDVLDKRRIGHVDVVVVSKCECVDGWGKRGCLGSGKGLNKAEKLGS